MEEDGVVKIWEDYTTEEVYDRFLQIPENTANKMRLMIPNNNEHNAEFLNNLFKKITMKQLILSFILVIQSIASYAYPFIVDGICYNQIPQTEEVEVTRHEYLEYSGDVTIPEKITYGGKEYKVTSIGEDAFFNCRITSVTIPNSVTTIGNNAFSNCEITSVTIPNSVTTIGNYAFYTCPFLTSITIGNSVANIGNHAFDNCYSLSSVTIPNSVTTIGDYAFYSCRNLTAATIGNFVTRIGDYAFYNCKLSSIIIPNSVTTIGECAFAECFGINSITIPNSVTSIGRSAFARCYLAYLKVDEGNPNYCSEDNVLFNKKKTELILCANSGKQGAYTIPNSVTTICYGAFDFCSGLTSITIPNSVTSIGAGAFNFCSGLTSITIPNSVTSIGNSAFDSCQGLTSVTIGNSVTSIGQYAFARCENLKEVYSLAGKVPSTEANAFAGSYITSATLYIPVGSRKYYRDALPWKDFENIIEMDMTAIESVVMPNGTSVNGNIYNLNGTKADTNNLPSGIYIKNGKKVLVK